MHLLNFRLKGEYGTIKIDAEGETWNLHDALFLGLRQWFRHDERGCPLGTEAELCWQANPAVNTATVFSLRFHDVGYLEVTPRDSQMPPGEDACLDSVGKVALTDDTAELLRTGYQNTEYNNAEEAHLYFRFRGGQTVRIGCRAAEFIALP